MTGCPVRSAKPAGDSRSAPTVAFPTMPAGQPTPARTRRAALGRQVFEHLGELGAQPLGGDLRRVVEQLGEGRSLKRQHAELGQDLLLPHALQQRMPAGFAACGALGLGLDHGSRRLLGTGQGQFLTGMFVGCVIHHAPSSHASPSRRRPY